eukprot:TRINITY_DN8062_c0_g1_i1.p1 TRINITY_DN8062_c0_g1~~TRINITY_DN8062_c0_g1_i1.p1  ORF type:complete len:227 (-),score=51.63 TRINITY_DN8062_c0_g1_i1:22-702(-)
MIENSSPPVSSVSSVRVGISDLAFDIPPTMKVGIVKEKGNQTIVDAIADAANKEMTKYIPPESIETFVVPGSFDIPFACQLLVETKNVDAVLCIGCLIKGETMQEQYMSGSILQGIKKVSLKTGVPIINGILICQTEEIAKETAGLDGGHNQGTELAHHTLQMAKLKIDNPSPHSQPTSAELSTVINSLLQQQEEEDNNWNNVKFITGAIVGYGMQLLLLWLSGKK